MIWSAFYDFVLQDIPGAEAPVVDHNLRRAATEFCEETCVYRVDATPVNIVANTALYALVSPVAETEPVQVRRAWANGAKLTIVSEDDLAGLPGYFPGDTAQAPTALTQPTQDKVLLYPIPTVAVTSGLVMNIAIRPTLTATGIVDWMGERYMYDLANGCKALMMETIGKPWSSDKGGMHFRSLFEGAKTKAIIDASRSFGRVQQRVRMSRTW